MHALVVVRLNPMKRQADFILLLLMLNLNVSSTTLVNAERDHTNGQSCVERALRAHSHHKAITPSGPRALRVRVPIAQRDPTPLYHLRYHPRPTTYKALFFEPHAHRERRLVPRMGCPLHAPKAESTALAWCAGQQVGSREPC